MPRDVPEEPLELAPLRGLRYAAPDARAFLDSPAFDIALALAPPYDVLDAASYSELVRADPHNAVRLTVPPAAVKSAEPRFGLADPDRYRSAARTLRRWLEDGVLVRDPAPLLYVYEQVCPSGDRQRGLIGALRLPHEGTASVRPHEDVTAGPVTDRARLMAATRANLEPIFLLYRGGTGSTRGTATRATESAEQCASLLVDTVTRDGVAHRLWGIEDPRLQADIAADLATRRALIADGHHRYAAYRRLRAQQRNPGPYDHGLAFLVDSEAWPPRLGAIHRVLLGLDVHEAADAASAVATIERLPGRGSEPERVRENTERLKTANGPALLLAGTDDHYLLRDPDQNRLAAAAPEHSAAWRALPSAVLDHLLLPLWDVGEDRVELVHDDPVAAAEAAGSGSDTAVIVPPMRVEDVYAITARGELTPRKSTSFGPKPRTGLVLRSMD